MNGSVPNTTPRDTLSAFLRYARQQRLLDPDAKDRLETVVENFLMEKGLGR